MVEDSPLYPARYTSLPESLLSFDDLAVNSFCLWGWVQVFLPPLPFDLQCLICIIQTDTCYYDMLHLFHYITLFLYNQTESGNLISVSVRSFSFSLLTLDLNWLEVIWNIGIHYPWGLMSTLSTDTHRVSAFYLVFPR